MGHTPGPWKYSGRSIFSSTKLLKRGRMDMQMPIAECVDCIDVDKTEKDANARLIATAPELLEALKTFVEAEEEWSKVKSGMPAGTFDDHLGDAYKLAKTAIANACNNTSAD